MRIRRLRRADRDLDDIYDYIAQFDAVAAAKMVRRLTAATDHLEDHPQFGRSRADVAPGARSVPMGRYVILYSITAEAVEIVRVVHGARDLGSIEMD